MDKQHTEKEGETMDTATAKVMGRAFYNTPNSRAIPNNDKALTDAMASVDGFNKRIKIYKAWLAGWNEANGEIISSIVIA